MYCVTVLFEVAPESFEEFLLRVRRQAEQSLANEPACRTFDIWHSPDRQNQVFLYEIYDDRAAFDAHLRSDHFRAFDRETAAWVTDKTIATWGTKA